jgi:predicted HicB family RNase H-like nuclease
VKANKQDQYTYRVTWSEEDGEPVGLCAEFPGLSWLAKTPETALRGIRRTVADVVADMEAEGEAVPEPLATRKFSGKILVRIPPEVHRDLVREASEEHVSLNRLVSARLAYPHAPANHKQRAKAAAG